MDSNRFQVYFPHVDNVYSHRSTQKYKRKPFVSHYWDCRLKGRPPGTAKSDDPNKKKRKRQARERDQCDVKIKVTEYFPGARAAMVRDGELNASENDPGLPGSDGARYYTIQRVNGNGANGKTDTVTGGHRHTIEESDRIKKNSIYRHFLKEEKERRKSTVSIFYCDERDWICGGRRICTTAARGPSKQRAFVHLSSFFPLLTPYSQLRHLPLAFVVSIICVPLRLSAIQDIVP